MTDQYYRVDVIGSVVGQRVMNTLYYKSEMEIAADLFPHAGAEGLATNFVQEVWNGAWKAAVSESYVCEEISVMPYNGAFELIYTQPYRKVVNEHGDLGDDCMPPSSCVNIHFNLAAQNAAQAVFTPKRGYIAIAGIPGGVQDDGILNAEFWNNDEAKYTKLAKKLAQNLQELTPPAIWKPVRMKSAGAVGTTGQIWLGAAEIIDAYPDPLIKNRRSRQRGS